MRYAQAVAKKAQTAWTEDQFTVTSSAGIRNREKRAADTVARELKRAKPGAWACIQAREVWSTEEEANMRPGHFWICKLGTVPGSMSCVEQKFDLQGRETKRFERVISRKESHGTTLLPSLRTCEDPPQNSWPLQQHPTANTLHYLRTSCRTSNPDKSMRGGLL